MHVWFIVYRFCKILLLCSCSNVRGWKCTYIYVWHHCTTALITNVCIQIVQFSGLNPGPRYYQLGSVNTHCPRWHGGGGTERHCQQTDFLAALEEPFSCQLTPGTSSSTPTLARSCYCDTAYFIISSRAVNWRFQCARRVPLLELSPCWKCQLVISQWRTNWLFG